MKIKSFTLIEILVSITLFSILIIFLYQALETTTKNSQFYNHKLQQIKQSKSLKETIFLDFHSLISKDSIQITSMDNGNNILQFKSSNNYHNPFYNHITYFVSKKHNFIRIESKNKLETSYIEDTFFETAFVDRVLNNIIKFQVTRKGDTISFYFKNKKEEVFFMNKQIN